MKFDKSRVYTAVNAEELPIGSRCLFANSLKDLKDRIYLTDTYGRILEYVCSENEEERFYGDDATYILAYLIEPPSDQKDPEYKPFSSVEKAMEAIQKHGGWIKSKTTQEYFLISALKSKKIAIIGNEYWESFSFLLERYVFADDGSPCGELVEE